LEKRAFTKMRYFTGWFTENTVGNRICYLNNNFPEQPCPKVIKNYAIKLLILLIANDW